ncbi:MAG: branched-chain amino acid aminotransferase [Chlorobi bacterium]|nr:MAG: branched-chain amino acid aminotransferase [Chlorobi bacterium OLB7]MBK8911599.1 branched-chain amino acid aminotransferase [Chlorobiota bacterium]
MQITVHRTTQPKAMPDAQALGFGKYFTDQMFLMDHSPESGWHTPRIAPYTPFLLDPANLTLHYGQSIFEGLKAFARPDGSIHIFRLLDHMDRFVRSAERLGMPLFHPSDVAEAIETLVDLDRNWVPKQRGTALYIRPTLIAADNVLGVRPADHYLMYVICSPVGSYYSKGTAPTRIYVEETYSRSSLGGLGEAKTAANYAASLLAAEESKAKGFDQVLWLDAKEHRFVEEVGTMNIFFVIDDVLITPPLNGTILDGITRRSVIELAREWHLHFQERPITMDEVVEASRSGTLQEVFGSGTAATISPVGELNYKGEALIINERPNSIRQRMYDTITGIQYGEIPDTHNWLTLVEPHAAANNGNGNHYATPEANEVGIVNSIVNSQT